MSLIFVIVISLSNFAAVDEKTIARELYSAVGKKIRSHRTDKGFSQEQIAEAVHLTRTSIVNIEKGRQRTPLHLLFAIARFLHIEPTSLIPTMEEIEAEMPKSSLKEILANRDDLDPKEIESLKSLLKDL